MLGSWDDRLFDWVNHDWSSPPLDVAFRFFTLGSKLPIVIAFLVIVLIAHLFASAKSRAAAIQTMIAWPIANGVTDVFKKLFYAARPCVVHPDYVKVADYAGKAIFSDSSGIMSAHAANMAAVATVITLRLKWWGAPWILVALLSGLSRIYVGVHYPSQVMLGWLTGIAVASVVVKAWDFFARKNKAIDTHTL